MSIACDPQSLVTQAQCLECGIPPGAQIPVLIYLLCQAVNNSGGGGGGSGTVTNFTAGNLSPLFNSSVATPTTTPALTFAQITQAAHLFFAGPGSGAAANPTFRALVQADLPAGFTATVFTFLSTNLINTAHGLGATPTKVRAVLVNVGAENGYSVGDEFDVVGISDNSSLQSYFSFGANSTNVFCSSSQVLAGNEATTVMQAKGGGSVNMTNAANWNLKLYASLN